MPTAAVSSTSIDQQQYLQTRHTDLKQLEQSLKNGDLAGAQAAYQNIVALGQSGPFATRNPFKQSQRAQDFNAVGEALKAGDLAGAQHAFATLRATFQQGGLQTDPPAANPAAASGPEIILNLSPINTGSGGSASPEQITINISNQANGGEQISIGIGSQGSNTEQVTLNLPSNSNEQIVLNLLGASSATSGSSTSTSSTASSTSGGLSVSA